MKTSMTIVAGLVAIITPISLWAGGTVVDTTISSQSLNMDRDVRIYLPEGYDPDGVVTYPVVYFLHGATVTYHIYWDTIDLASMLDGLIAEGVIEPIIFVTPDGSMGPYSGSFYTNSELYGQFEDFIANDMTAFIDTTYQTRASRDGRAIMGHSMGGYGCMKLAMKHPDTYCAVASHSGVMDLQLVMSIWRPYVMDQNSPPPYIYYPEAGIFTLHMFAMAGAFSPNLQNWPYRVDLPMDADGEIVEEVMARWSPHDPPRLAAEMPPAANLAIYFDCGLQDWLHFLPLNEAFADSLDELGLPYEYQTYVGDHSDQIHLRIPIALSFIDSVFQTTVCVADDGEDVPGEEVPRSGLDLEVYPNPFNPQTTVVFTLDRPQPVEVAVYNLSGKRIAVLANCVYQAGEHATTWNGRDFMDRTVPSGTYLVCVQTGDSVRASKVMLVR